MLTRQNWIRVAVILGLLSPAAAETAQRTFVSAGSGSDSNPCTRQLPCRNFAAAMAQTDPNGEVVVLDSGGYGTVSIDKSVALVASAGVHAGITAFSGNAITVAAGASDVVILRGLYLSGLGGLNGIDFQSGKTLHVENCVVSGFTYRGVSGHAAGADVYIKDTIGRQNSSGFYFTSGFATIRASLDSVRAEENQGNGVHADGNAVVAVTRGLAAGNNSGFDAGSSAVISLESCTAIFNNYGVYSLGTGTVQVANSMITKNNAGVENVMGGSTISFGNNRLNLNTVNGSFTNTIAQQ